MKTAFFVCCLVSLAASAYLSFTTGPENVEGVNANSRRGLNWAVIAALFYWMSI